MQSLFYTPLKLPEKPRFADLLVIVGHPYLDTSLWSNSTDELLVDATLTRAGLDPRLNVAFTSVVKVAPADPVFLTEDEIYSWMPNLLSDLIDTCPKRILALGPIARRAVVLLGDRIDGTPVHFVKHPQELTNDRDRNIWMAKVGAMLRGG